MGARLGAGLLNATGRLPWRVAGAGGASVGALLYRAGASRRRRALDALARSLPELPEARRAAIARGSFAHAGRVAAEMARLGRMTPDERAALCADHDALVDAVRADLARGNGLFVLSAHFGQWELLGALLAAIAPTTGVQQDYADPKQADHFTRLRTRFGVRIIGAGGRSLRPGLALGRALARNEVAVTLLDKPSRRDGELVPFLGRPAWTSLAPFALARATGCALRPIYLVRDGDRFRAIVHDRLSPEEGPAAWSRGLEREVRARPEQWLWTLRRWPKTDYSAS